MRKQRPFHPGRMRVFVFFSNLAGMHVRGAAEKAFRYYGAHGGNGDRWGAGSGYMSNGDSVTASYAIPTLDRRMQRLSPESVKTFIDQFFEFAKKKPGLTFFVNLNDSGNPKDYTNEELKPFFQNAPPNIDIPEEWRGQ